MHFCRNIITMILCGFSANIFTSTNYVQLVSALAEEFSSSLISSQSRIGSLPSNLLMTTFLRLCLQHYHLPPNVGKRGNWLSYRMQQVNRTERTLAAECWRNRMPSEIMSDFLFAFRPFTTLIEKFNAVADPLHFSLAAPRIELHFSENSLISYSSS